MCHAQKPKEFHMSVVYLDEVCSLRSIGYIKTASPATEQNIYDRFGSVCKPQYATTTLLGFPALITQEKEVNSPVTTDGDQNHAKNSHIISSHHCQCIALANSSCHLKKKILDTELGNMCK
jgi:hypothetical protein